MMLTTLNLFLIAIYFFIKSNHFPQTTRLYHSSKALLALPIALYDLATSCMALTTLL